MAYRQEQQNISSEEFASLCDQLRALLSRYVEQRVITANERHVMEYRFALDGMGTYLTYEEIAPVLSLTRERIRQILVKAIRRVRKQSEFVHLMRCYLAVVTLPPELLAAAARLTDT